ncbi:MAG: ComEC/Rec2 family competence protein [Isosphaeraceae bacterium]
MTSEAKVLTIYLYGSTEGESIALHLPDGKWGVVDSFASSLKDPASNPTYSLLKRENVTELEFLCLTHPHDDHFRGMSQLLKGFTAKQFWTFFGPDPTDVQLLKTYFWAEAQQADRATLKESAEELASIFDTVEKGRIDRQVVMSRRLMYPVPKDEGIQVEIWGIAPTDDRAQSYKKSLLRSFTKNPGKVQALPHAKHNTISIGLRITFGRARILLGGDVEEEAWRTVLLENRPEDLASHFVKISHHGSTTGYCPELWPVLSNQGSARPIAALTPYRRFRLPDPNALDHIRGYTRAIHSASRSGHAERTENWRIAALAKLKAASAGKFPSPTPASGVGCCEIEVNEQGECRVILHSPACTLCEQDSD